MIITLNGKLREIEGSHSITSLLQSLNINARQVAVAVNGEVVMRDTWPQVLVSEGDAVEVVRAVGGGGAT